MRCDEGSTKGQQHQKKQPAYIIPKQHLVNRPDIEKKLVMQFPEQCYNKKVEIIENTC